jgi:hypothetical protein
MPTGDVSTRFEALRRSCDAELNRERDAITSELSSLTDAAAAAAVTLSRCASEIAALPMPSTATPDAKALVAAYDRLSAYWHEISGAKSPTDLIGTTGPAIQLNADLVAATAALERDLGLPFSTPRV